METEIPRREIAFRGFIAVLSITREASEWERYVIEELRRYSPGGTQLYREKRALELLRLTGLEPTEQSPDGHIEEGRRLRSDLEHVASEIAPNHGFAPDAPIVRGIAFYYVNASLESLEEQQHLQKR